MKIFLPLAIVVCVAPAWAQNSVNIRVLDADGKPIAGAIVAARVLSADPVEVAPQTTDATGKAVFSMPNEKNGDPSVGSFTAGAKGYSFGKSKLAIGLTTGPLEIRLTRGQTWRGKVVDSQGKPLAGARVSLRGARQGHDYATMIFLDDEALGALYSAQSGADGTFEIPNLPTDMTLGYIATLPNFAQFVGRDGSVDASELIKMAPGGTIQGRALDAAGKPLAKFRIYASPVNDGYGADKSTDADGKFTLDGLAPGEYDLSAVLPDGATFIMPPTKGVRVAAGETTAAGEWRAIKGAEIRGFVIDSATKKPIVGASFAAQNKDDINKNNDSAWAISDATGHFVLRVSPGQYKVRSSGGGNGYLRSESTQSAQPTNETPAQMRFELQAAPIVRGITRDESGAPVAAKIVVGGEFGGMGTQSDAQGRWQYTPPDTDDVTFGGGEDDEGYFEIVSPKRVDWPVKGPITVTVRRKPWQSLAGRVVTPGGTPVEGAKVEAEFTVQTSDNGGYGARVSAVSDADGRYLLEKLRDSRRPDVMGTEVRVSAKREGYQFQSGGKVTREGKEPRVSDLVFAPLSASVVGTTRAGALVVVAGRETRADDAGRFSFDALPAGGSTIYAAKDDLFGSAPSTQKPLEIALSRPQPQGRDEALARELWASKVADKADDYVLDLDQWQKGGGFEADLRAAQRSGEPDQIAYALGEWKPTDAPGSLALALEVLAAMEPSEARTGAYLSIAVSGNDAALTERALALARAQFDAKTTETRTREWQLYLASILIERRDGAKAGAFALRTAMAYTLQTHPEQSRIEDAMQTAVGRNEALMSAAAIVAPGAPALLREVLETIENGSGFAVRARAEAIPVVAQARGLAGAAPLLEELQQMPAPTLDMKVRYQSFDVDWALGQAVHDMMPFVGPTDPAAALEWARKVKDDEQRARALASAAHYQPLEIAAPILREAVEAIGSENAPRVAAYAYGRDAKLGLELFEIARRKAEGEMTGERFYRNSWIPFAFYYARANPAQSRLILEREWAKSREAKADDHDLSGIATAMAPADARRAAEMASELNGYWGLGAQVKIARYLVSDEKTRDGFYLDRSGAREPWDEGKLQW